MHARMGGKQKLVQLQLNRERPAGASSRALQRQQPAAGGRGAHKHRISTQQSAAEVPGAAEAAGGGVNIRGDDDDAEQHPPPAAAPPSLKRAKAAGSLDLAALVMPSDWASHRQHQHQQPASKADAGLAAHQGSAAASATGS